jgi:hypothetical protein
LEFSPATLMNETTRIGFSSQVPTLPSAENADWFFDGFYPQLLSKCPTDTDETYDFQPFPFDDVEASIDAPREWTRVFPEGKSGRDFVFALLKGFISETMIADGTEIRLFYRSDDFKKLIPTIKQTFEFGRRWLGDSPYRVINVIESSQLQRINLPAMIAINRPQQAAFRLLQSDFLNWNQWTMVSLIVQQWFGSAIKPNNIDNQWLVRGFCDFVALEILKQMPAQFDLVNSEVVPIPILSVNYRELQDMQATILNWHEPKAVLTNGNLNPVKKYLDQSPLIGMRHTMALRQIHGYLGTAGLSEVLAGFTARSMHKRIKPRDFYEYLQSNSIVPQKSAAQAARYLKIWWTIPGWPDEEILDFKSTKNSDGSWTSRVLIKQNNDVGFPMSVKVEDRNNATHYGPAEEISPNIYELKINSPDEGKNATLDPNHTYFDENRFNNTTKWPRVRLYPGDAHRVADDDYTVLWFLYPFRRPGDPWSVALNSAIFRYLNSALKIKAATEIGPMHRSSFEVSQRHDMPNYALTAELGAKQDLHGSRVIEARVERNPFFNRGPKLGIYLGLRARQVVGSKGSGHETGAIGFNLNPWQKPRFCNYMMQGEFEAAPRETSEKFQYERRFFVGETYCPLFAGIDTRLRAFRGEITGQGPLPPELLFNPQDVEFASLRLDLSGLKNSRQIFSANTDLFLPLVLPLPGESYLVTRRLKWRAFYDYGRAMDLRTDYHAAGGGILLPFGGDISSVGTISVMNFSFLAVLYSAAENRTSKEPRYLIDFSTDL